MTPSAKIYLYISLIVFGMIGGWYLRPTPKPETKVEYVHVENKAVDRVITRTITAKGETIEKIVEKEVVKNKIESIKQSMPSKPQYSVAAYTVIDSTTLKKDYQIFVGMRLAESPVFVEGGWSTQKQILVGLRLEF